MKTVKIPAWKNPYPVTINGKEQRFPSGKKIEVEDNIAEIIQRDIDAHASAATPTPTPEKNTPLQVKIWLGENEKWECDTPAETIIKATKAGRIIACNQDDGQSVGYDDEAFDDGLHKITIGGHYSLEYVKDGYDITKDIVCGLGVNLLSPYMITSVSRQCFNKKYISFEDGSTITVRVEGAVAHNAALCFVSKKGAKRMALGDNITAYVTDTGWQPTPLTCVVPDDTAYIWVNLKRVDDYPCNPSDITRITVRKVS